MVSMAALITNEASLDDLVAYICSRAESRAE
jgi:hypothetical protein